MRLLLITLLLSPLLAMAYELHDAHIHYSKSVWQRLPPEDALRHMAEQDIRRAIVSSTPTEGTEMLYRLAPDRVIPFLRPYRDQKERMTWHHQPEIISYIQSRASSGIYRGFGEFHIWKEDLDGNSIFPQVLQIAVDNDWVLSAHTDQETIETIFRLQPTLKVIWAHCGFDVPAEMMRQLMQTYPGLYCEMSFYDKMFDSDLNLLPQWKTLMQDLSGRFMVGTDPYTEVRWASLRQETDFIRAWLNQLSADAAEQIASGNLSRLFP
jgi:hypothetical protein